MMRTAKLLLATILLTIFLPAASLFAQDLDYDSAKNKVCQASYFLEPTKAPTQSAEPFTYYYESPQSGQFCRSGSVEAACGYFNTINLSKQSLLEGEEASEANEARDYLKTYCGNQQFLQNLIANSSLQNKLKDLEGADCVRYDSKDTTTCNPSGDSGFFYQLQQAIFAGYPIVVLEEPIGTENVVNRLSMCSTKLIRDETGAYQKIGDSSHDKLEGRYAIEINDCQQFLVPQCQPNNWVVSQIYLDPTGQDSAVVKWPQGTNELNGNPEAWSGSGMPVISYCTQVQVITDSSGSGILKNYVGLIYRWAASFVGVIAVVVIMLSGIQISAAGGEGGSIEEAKGRIIQSLSALALLFLSGLILYAINPTYFRASPQFIGPEVVDDQATTGAQSSGSGIVSGAEGGEETEDESN